MTASGAGAASRHSIGTGVFGGMLAVTFLAIFFVPLFFVLIVKLSRRRDVLRIQRTEREERTFHPGGSHDRV